MSPDSSKQARMVPIPNSEHKAPEGCKPLGPTPADKEITVTVVLKRKQPLDVAKLGGKQMTRQEYLDEYGATDAAIEQIRQFAQRHSLQVVEASRERRRVWLKGTAAQLQAAFGVTLNEYEDGGSRFHALSGPVSMPEPELNVVETVLGLDTRPIARPHIRYLKQIVNANPNATLTSFTPPQVAQIYDYPTDVNGAGQCIALIELGGGFTTSDIQTYFQQLGLTPPTVVAVPVDGGTNSPGDPSGADAEVALDIQVAGAIAPGAKIAVYFAPNTDQGFQDAISAAIHDTTNNPSVISISWGGPEPSWTQNALASFDNTMQTAAALGVTITVASGDNGSTDGVSDGADHVDFPASSPNVLACGGTQLTASNSTRQDESVWNDLSQGGGATGGGVSAFFALPTWQAGANVPQPTGGTGGRGVPDVAGDAAPATGYQILVDGQSETVGGTSAVAPLWAALIALVNQKGGKQVGFVNPTLYGAGESGFFDVTQGNNGDFSAGAGWDPCTGLGSPDGVKVSGILGAAASSSGSVGY
jgi:kumamolisin